MDLLAGSVPLDEKCDLPPRITGHAALEALLSGQPVLRRCHSEDHRTVLLWKNRQWWHKPNGGKWRHNGAPGFLLNPTWAHLSESDRIRKWWVDGGNAVYAWSIWDGELP